MKLARGEICLIGSWGKILFDMRLQLLGAVVRIESVLRIVAVGESTRQAICVRPYRYDIPSIIIVTNKQKNLRPTFDTVLLVNHNYSRVVLVN